MIRLKFARLIAPLFVVSIAVGCTSTPFERDSQSVTAQPKAEKMPRAKEIFLYQSRVVSQIFDRYPSLDLLQRADPELLRSEAQMMESCSVLTQAVLGFFDGEEPSFGLCWRVVTSIDDCEAAARRTDGLLNDSLIADSI